MNRRHLVFLLFLAAAFLMAFGPIKALYDSGNQREYYSHIVLIPLVSIYLVYQERKRVFAKLGNPGEDSQAVRRSSIAGVVLLAAGSLLYAAGWSFGAGLNQNDLTAILALSAVTFLNGGFILSFGLSAFKAALFPLLFLVFVIPIPSPLMDGIVSSLQAGSTEFANLLFMASGVSYIREGVVFHLPGMSVEVARECSGIRSGLALFITCVVAGHLFLETGWKKILLAVLAIPVAMFKNGIRIVTLTLLGTYVDPRILQSPLHREGGIPFFVVALVLMVPILYGLRKSEK